jgi:RNA polymerase sigma factor (sigma-70 family)
MAPVQHASIGAYTTGADFATTHWSVVLSAGNGDLPIARQALEKLCQTYWYPLYAFIRRRGHSPEAAEDLTQEFFARLLAKDFPAGIKPDGGRFRSYLLTAVNHFLVNEWQKGQTQKRGSGQHPLSFEELRTEASYQFEPIDALTPERLFERQWASSVLNQVRQRLRDEHVVDGKARLFERLQGCLTGAEQLMPYAALAAEFRLTESAVKMAVHRLRKRYGELLREEIAQTVSGPEQVDEEIRCLLSAVAS